MKKLFALILTLALSVSVVACSSGDKNNGAADNNDANNQQEVQQDDKDTAEPLFDNSWTENDYEKLIPQPPFEGWTAQMNGNAYEMETLQANADLSGTYYDTFAEYSETLKECGFTLDVIGDINGKPYYFKAVDTNGNNYEFKCGDGGAWITIVKAE